VASSVILGKRLDMLAVHLKASYHHQVLFELVNLFLGTDDDMTGKLGLAKAAFAGLV
jgi:hypothetical protein